MKTILKSAVAAAALLSFASITPALSAGVGACLITKEDANPFFVKMKEGATAKAKELGVDFKAYAGKQEGDTEGQVAAVETCIADGVKGILITPSDTKAMVPSLKSTRTTRTVPSDTATVPRSASAPNSTPRRTMGANGFASIHTV